jgi:hypothetical protein
MAVAGLSFVFLSICGGAVANEDEPASLDLILRSRKNTAAGQDDWRIVERQTTLGDRWEAAKTAAVVCDMWDRLWCAGATARVAEMAPRMNDLLMKQRGITNVLVMGVHTNMCVLGRPFAIRQLIKQGMQVALVRDLTDTMYNPKSRPFVDHFAGTDLVVGHIEKFWCPTVTSDQILGGAPFRFAGDKGAIVLPRMGARRVASYRCGVDLTTGKADVAVLKLAPEEEDQWNDMRKDVLIGSRTFTVRIEDNRKRYERAPNWARVSVVEVDGKDGKPLRTIPVREFVGGYERHGFRGLALKGDRLSVFVSFWVDD